MDKITAVILVKNEENNILDCLELLSWCNEILVIDDNSTDRTVELAKKNKATVISHDLNNNFSQQRNFALQKAKNEWVFFVDADERVNAKLQSEIIHELSDTHYDAFYIKREDFMWGKHLKHGETGSIYLLRLAKKNSGKWIGKVHESWISLKRAGELKNPLYHYPHVTVADFLSEINFYSTLRSQELFEQGIKTNWLQIIAFPKAKFVINYIIRKGFLDGTAGLLLAILMSFHSFLVRGKLWMLWQKR